MLGLFPGPRVVQAQNPTSPVQATIEARPAEVYLHQTFQLILSIRTSGVRLGKQVNLLSLPATSKLETEQFEQLPSERRVRGNVVEEIRHYRCRARALVPGSIELTPIARVRILTRERLFFGSTWHETPRDVLVTPTTVRVRPLPEAGRPEAFSGAVGRFDMAVQVEPQDVAVGDLVKITTTISGDGYLQSVSPPGPRHGPGFKIYDPKRVEATEGKRVYEQVFIPRTTNALSIPELSFAFFDPTTERYRTIVRGPFPLTFHERSAPVAEHYRPGQPSALTPEAASAESARLPYPELRPVMGASNDDLTKAYQAYTDGYADAAIEALESADTATHDPVALWFNLGNAYVQAGRYPEAILNYARARVARPRDAAVQANLNYVRRKLGVPGGQSSRLMRVAVRFTPREWLIGGIGCMLLALLGFALRRTRRGLPIVGLLGVLLCLGAGLTVVRAQRATAIVMNRQEARFAPTRAAKPLFSLPAGASLRVLERTEDWLRIDWTGRRGWVLASGVEPVTEAAPRLLQTGGVEESPER